MDKDKLRARTRKQLLGLAKRKGLRGRSSMSKDQLVSALYRLTRDPSSRSNGRKRAAGNGSRPRRTPARPARRVGTGSVRRTRAGKAKSRDLSLASSRGQAGAAGVDRAVLVACDAHWLHARWQLTRASVKRAQASLGPAWHEAVPVLRVFDVTSKDTTATTETHVNDIGIDGGISNWYVNVGRPDRSYRVDIGYLPRSRRFYSVAKSNVAHTPCAHVSDAIDENWIRMQDEARKGSDEPRARPAMTPPSAELKALFEERLRRPMSAAAADALAADRAGGDSDFWFSVDAELIVYGATKPGAKVSLQGESVPLRPDGTFTMRVRLPDSRQIIPAVASTHDGLHERTVVLAVERNTKHLEPAGTASR